MSTYKLIPYITSRRSLSFIYKDYACSNKSNLKPFKDIPGPFRIPIWGNLYLYKLGKYKVEHYHKVLEELYKTYGPIVRQDLGRNTIIHVFDPDDIRTVYGNEDSMPYASPLLETTQIYRKKKKMSPGLGNVNGEEWYRLRSAVRQMMLRPKEVYYYLPMVQEVANDFVQHLEDVQQENVVENLRDHVARWVLESAGMVCFETRLGSLSKNQKDNKCQQLIDANTTLFRLSGLLKFALPIYRFIPTPKWIKILQEEDVFYQITNGYINGTIKQLQNAQHSDIAAGKFNFMAYLLSRKELSREDTHVITISLFSDGLSTTVPAILFNLYCLAMNPNVQEKAYQEIKLVLKNNEPITVDKLNKLHYLKAIVKETFRHYPIGTEVSRMTKKDMILSGYEIPSGTHVNLTPNVHFLSEEHFTNAKKFLPERWLRGKEPIHEMHPFLLTPFGHGTRTCAGRRFAEQDIHVLLCLILQKFKLTADVNQKPIEQIFSTLLLPDGDIPIKFMKRDAQQTETCN